MSKKHKVIGIVCAGIHDTGAQHTMISLAREAESRGYKTIVISNFTYYEIEDYSPADSEIFQMMDSPVFDGLVLMPESIKSISLWEKVLDRAKATGIPFVCVDRDVPDCVSVTFSYGKSFEKVVRHIIEVHKPKIINFIGGKRNNSFSEERLNVFKKVLAENGREFEPERFGYGDFWETPTLAVLDKFYNGEQEPPDAIICVNDAEAMTCVDYLRNKGISLPDEVIISGFDGIEEEKYVVPRITTAACDIDGMSRKTMDLLEELMNGKTPSERLAVIDYSLRISQSCGCKPVDEAGRIKKLIELFIEKKNYERHERRMFEYNSHTGELDSYDSLARLMPYYCEFPTWVCIEPQLLYDGDDKNIESTASTGEMTMFMHSGNILGKFYPDTYTYNIPFQQKDILPDLDKVFNEHNSLLIAHLSYHGGKMGYLAVAMDSESFDFLFTHRFISNTNQIFETLKTNMQLQKAYEKVADMHMRDPMTGIYNRRGFYMRMSELTESGTTNYTLFSLDLDRLKYINDNFGHYAGDRAILTAAMVISSTSGKDSVCARFGGDEFIVVIPEKDDTNTADAYIKSVESEIEKINSEKTMPFTLSISIGGTSLKVTDRENIEIAMKEADKKMYECKRRNHAIRD